MFAASIRFRSRMLLGVTSINSSSLMKALACSSPMRRGGIRRMASSADDARMFVCFFSFVTLTSMSLLREFSPMIIPSYTSVWGSMKISPRSCRFAMAKAVAMPVRSATSAPVLRDDHALVVFGDVDHELFDWLRSDTIDVLGDDLGPRHLQLERFAAHHLNQDRQLQLAAAHDLQLFGRVGILHPQRHVAKQLALEPIAQV